MAITYLTKTYIDKFLRTLPEKITNEGIADIIIYSEIVLVESSKGTVIKIEKESHQGVGTDELPLNSSIHLGICYDYKNGVYKRKPYKQLTDELYQTLNRELQPHVKPSLEGYKKSRGKTLIRSLAELHDRRRNVAVVTEKGYEGVYQLEEGNIEGLMALEDLEKVYQKEQGIGTSPTDINYQLRTFFLDDPYHSLAELSEDGHTWRVVASDYGSGDDVPQALIRLDNKGQAYIKTSNINNQHYTRLANRPLPKINYGLRKQTHSLKQIKDYIKDRPSLEITNKGNSLSQREALDFIDKGNLLSINGEGNKLNIREITESELW